MSLRDYRGKRDFEKTVEPNGKNFPKSGKRRFVVQKHAASRLHYDFRLELDGTLKSWAVPKGVPYTKGEKRLAVHVEDHPVSYINFEGSIPKGQYGGGTVMVWDQGTFEPLSERPSKDLAAGKLHFILSGRKLVGEWYLVRLRDGKDWLLIRGKNDMRPVSKKLDDTSSLSGKNMKQLAAGSDVCDSIGGNAKISKTAVVKKKPETPFTIKFVEPMKARLVAAPPEGDWIYEIKHDGFRAIALKQGTQIRLYSRNEKDFAERFPEVADAIREVSAREAILDGEIVALDAKGRSSFQLLQSSDTGQERPPLFFYAFDLLQLNGRNLEKQPLLVRKALLEKLLKEVPGVLRYSASLEGNGAHLLKQARKLGLEGLIAKRKESVYEPGKRSGAWVKLKLHQQQEFVIGGCTAPSGSRQHFGALLVGYHGDKGLCFAGKVGTGFNEALLRSMNEQFKKLEISDCPFENLPEKKLGRFGQGITAGEMKKCRWLKPSLVCQIKFSEWTRDRKLRQPVFLGLREDKLAKEVIRETPQ